MEAVQGSKLVYLYRVHSKASANEGVTLALTKENKRTVSKSADATNTKDGSIRTPSPAESEITATSLLAKDDTVVEELEEAMLKDELIDIWEANLAQPGTGANKFKGTYFQGYITNFEKSSPSEDFVEISLTFGINGNGAKGDVTVSVEQQEAAAYVFEDTVKKTS